MKTFVYIMGIIAIIYLCLLLVCRLLIAILKFKKFITTSKLNKIAATITRHVLRETFKDKEFLEKLDIHRMSNLAYNNIMFSYDNKIYLAKLMINCIFDSLESPLSNIKPYDVGLWIFDPKQNKTLYKFVLNSEDKVTDMSFDKKFVNKLYKDLGKKVIGIRIEGFTYKKGEQV